MSSLWPNFCQIYSVYPDIDLSINLDTQDINFQHPWWKEGGQARQLFVPLCFFQAGLRNDCSLRTSLCVRKCLKCFCKASLERTQTKYFVTYKLSWTASDLGYPYKYMLH